MTQARLLQTATIEREYDRLSKLTDNPVAQSTAAVLLAELTARGAI